MQMVEADEACVEARLRAGEIECAECGGALRPWGFARQRSLRDHGQMVQLRPRRSLCRGCSEARGKLTTHVLLPTQVLLRRMDVVSVIMEALIAIHLEDCPRRQVATQAGVSLDTLRGWRRRFEQRAEEIRKHFTTLAHRWDPEQGGIEPQGSATLDALEAIGAAMAAGVRRFGPQPPWSLVAVGSAGRLLSNTGCPLPILG
jgi:hypothetical protein